MLVTRGGVIVYNVDRSSVSSNFEPGLGTCMSPVDFHNYLFAFVMFSARTQPIIVNATADMLKEHILPVAKQLREQAINMEKEEEEFIMEMRRMQHRKDGGEVEMDIQEV